MKGDDFGKREVDKIIGLKRHESPPDEFFDAFSDRVIARIEAEQGVARYMGYWRSALRDFDISPLFSGAYATVIVCLFVGAYSFSSKTLESPSLSQLEMPEELILLGRLYDEFPYQDEEQPVAEMSVTSTSSLSSVAPITEANYVISAMPSAKPVFTLRWD